MPSTVAVGTFDSDDIPDVKKIFQEFDGEVASELPQLRRRQVFTYSDLYIHLQDWDVADAAEAYQAATTDPRCARLNERLSAYFGDYTATDEWDGPHDQREAERFYLWPAERLENLEQTYSAIIVNKQLREHIPEVARLFAESDATDIPQSMGTLRRQIYLWRGVYLHIQDFSDSNSIEAISKVWTDGDPRFLQLVDDLTRIIPPYDPNSHSLATRFYHWTAEA
ncbi:MULTISPECIES: TcmI family type II polyketide cyclase [Actinomadura]|uniref:TcmI family type II polyketide cyclase n=1 Tax=Actinomadura litoris TaxID=2678616 RepID=A0A7K1L0M7_9ACTN|nr:MULTISPECIES: TcmI family type II polyketide cyclase [Actinomadura]MBT2206907.1 TcmI family type II polyketide cyclase [Actinomadura sp. NEAU-AAG7]MUN37992.1 TcmI family type II polyketide cyclase [Actinomadura litoris]